MLRERAGSDFRIQLEGQLEVVEAEVAGWRLAVVGLEGPEWRSDLRWRAVGPPDETYAEALAALKAKLGDEAGEYELLRELPRLKAKVRELAAGHLRSFEREIPSDTASALELLGALQTEVDSTAVVVSGDHWRALQVNATSMWSLLGLIVAMSYLLGADFTGRPGSLVLAILASLGLAFVMLRAAVLRPTTQVVVSPGSLRLQVNGQWVTVPTANLRSIRLARHGLEAVLTFELHDPTVISPSITFHAVPTGVIEALRAKGFAVDLSGLARPPTPQALADQRALEDAIERWRQLGRALQHRNWFSDRGWVDLVRERPDEAAAIARFRASSSHNRRALNLLASVQANVRSRAARLLRRSGQLVSPEADLQAVVQQLRRSTRQRELPSTQTTVPKAVIALGWFVFFIVLLIIDLWGHRS